MNTTTGFAGGEAESLRWRGFPSGGGYDGGMDPHTLPTHLTHAAQIRDLAETTNALRDLHQQAAILTIYEWFAQHPEFRHPFKVLIGRPTKPQPDGSVALGIKAGYGLTDGQHQVVAGLLGRVSAVHSPENNFVVRCLVDQLNEVEWEAGAVDKILRKAANEHTRVKQALFAHADRETLDGTTPSAGGRKPGARL